MNPTARPVETDARFVAAKYIGHDQFSIVRYPTGFCHYVYEVEPFEGPKIVVRMGHDDTRVHLEGSLFGAKQLGAERRARSSEIKAQAYINAIGFAAIVRGLAAPTCF
jgi:hypothetical protein